MLNPFEYLKVKKHEIKAKYDCQITIDMKDFENEIALDNAEKIIIPGIFNIYIPEFDDYVPMSIGYIINLIKPKEITEDANTQIYYYKKGDLIFYQDFFVNNFDIRKLVRLVEGRVKYIKTPETLVEEIHAILKNSDLVHFELIVQNMMRKQDDNEIRCRLDGDYTDAVILGQTKQASTNSLLSSISFQNLKKTLRDGLVNKRKNSNNPVEKIMNEDFD